MIDFIIMYSHSIVAVAGTTTVESAGQTSWTSNFLMLILIGLPIIAGLAILQIFLSKTQSKWPGLVLPGCNIFLSLIALFGFLMFAIDAANIILTAIGIFVLFNIPTLIYLAIYWIVRNNRKDSSKNNQEIQKMNIQDLE